MILNIKTMTDELASQIANWRYDAPYDLYTSRNVEESIREYLEDNYSAVVEENGNLVGFFCLGAAAQVPAGNRFGVYEEKFTDIGIGMAPELTGQGFGREFLSFIIKSIASLTGTTSLRLTVASFNKRAIHLYETCGFEERMNFETDVTSFIMMTRKLV